MMAAGRPDSKINGVQIGVITPYGCHNMPNDADSLLRLIVEDGNNATEIQCRGSRSGLELRLSRHSEAGGRFPRGTAAAQAN
jgi:hypothetical protein